VISASEVKRILQDPLAENRRWTLQGFGMLRLYVSDDEVWRLHLWDSDMSVEDVSAVHDHPWDLTSTVISGHLMNQRFTHVTNPQAHLNDVRALCEVWRAQQIRTGEGGHPLGPPEHWYLQRQPLESYRADESYHQDAPEIHESIPTPGTVTLVKRTFSRPRDIATSCYRTAHWVSAEPRPATDKEVMHFANLALARWGD
jgi:hypothetical protein